MQPNDKIHGFRVTRKIDAPEISAVGYEMVYEQNGAKLFWLDRADENKTFAIAFRTTPQDSTGVFHILEHSVLCGSDKFPSKDPFVELLKGSVKTFLNAFTFPDKTMYPVCSRNDKDFLNLMNVYLDAVLHPAALHQPEIFRQEGWHYEPDDEGNLTYKGVVLNEMRGAFSSPDEVGGTMLMKLLYPDSIYGLVSGGDPEVIPTLTYEQFVEAHKKFYHPSNSLIFLDGAVDLDAALGMIDSYLKDFAAQPMDLPIAWQKPLPHKEETISFEIAPNEDPKDKGRVILGTLAFGFEERETALACSVLLDVIAGSNEAPFKQRMLATGLCEDVALYPYSGIMQNAVVLEMHNVKDGRLREAEETAKKILADIAKEGIDKEQLTAAFNIFEFRTRERDFGSYPLGLIYGMNALESWLYGGDPIRPLLLDDDFNALRGRLQSRYFEELLASLFGAEDGTATLYMLPDPTLGEHRSAAEKAKLAAIRAGMDDGEMEKIRRENEALLLWQKTDDTPEILATLPSLSVSDIERKPTPIPTELRDLSGVPYLYHAMKTSGICYSSLYFDLSDFTEEELFDLSFATTLLCNVRTEKRSALDLQTAMKANVGSMSFTLSAVTRDGRAIPYLTVGGSVLESKKQDYLDLLSEVLFGSRFDEKETIRNIVKQEILGRKEDFSAGGSGAAMGRASAYLNAEAAILEQIGGYESYLKLKRVDQDFDAFFPKADETLRSLIARAAKKGRMTVSVTGEDGGFAEKLAALFPDGGEVKTPRSYAPLGVRNEGIVIPAQIGYAGMAADLEKLGAKREGSMNVLRSILSFGYLWNAIRVQGGAYGAGFGARVNGTFVYYSYRDPDPKASIGAFRGCGDFLRAAVKDEHFDLEKFIIGALGAIDPLYTPRVAAGVANSQYLRGIGYEDICREREETLSTTKEDLLRLADLLDRAADQNAYCIVAGKEKLDAAGDLIRATLEL